MTIAETGFGALRHAERAAPPVPGPGERLSRTVRALTLVEGWRRTFVALLAGGLIGLAHAPFDFPFVLFVAFPVLVLLIDGMAAGETGLRGRLLSPLWVGWCFGFAAHWSGLWWLGNALVTSGAGPVWLAPVAGAALSALLALFTAAAVLVARQFWTAGTARILALGAAWGIAEWLRAEIATGFPWNAIGYAMMPNEWLMQSVALVGMDGMNIGTVWAAAAVILLFERRTRILGFAIPVLLLGAHAGFGAWRLSGAVTEDSGTTVRVVQPAIAQNEKWDEAARVEIFRTLLDLSAPSDEAAGRPDIIVWPETAFPFVLSETPEALAVLGDVLDEGQTLLAGGVRTEGLGAGRLWFNSLFAIDAEGRVMATRDKVHLVPFGEYLPLPNLMDRLGLSKIVESPGDFTAATRRETLALLGGPVLLPLICYEVIFPRGMGAVGERPNVIVNVTNDAWFGETPGPWQHMRQARIRSVETGLPMIRAANDGVSAVVDPYGRIVAGLRHGERGAFDAMLPDSINAEFLSWRALPWVWLLAGFAFAMICGEAWRDRRVGELTRNPL